MFNLGNYLNIYKNKLYSQQEIKNHILQVLKSYNLNLTTNDLVLKDNILFIKAKPIIKSEIIFKKEKIMSDINNVLSGKIIDLR